LLLAIILVSCSSDSTGPEDDTIAPTVSILDIPYGASFSGIFSVTVYVNDDNNVDTVALYLDGQNIASTTSSPYIFYVNCNDVEDGVHTLQAKAQDEAGNIGESEFVAINTTYDFAPYSNGQIRVSITNYQQLDQLDLSSFGDPYFVYIIKIDGDEFATYTSEIWLNTAEIHTTISHTFDIPDNVREYQLIVSVRDSDTIGYEDIDYTSQSGYAYIWTLNPITSDFVGEFNGEDDGSSSFDDNDCEITLDVDTIN
jgi:hypothetical protein